ncbi:hypothetical protein F0562_006766 [Nyssa sinensis]|uniref:HTH myb-type domain-containing protein n=1 Tax=Nyssa sinensis TaxID=561372 RepID=A0A5J5AQR1_9ASTE|nr:hypothetical protein F0562_006766 [Nyssa sinensis]
MPKHIKWTFEENKLFENALAELNLETPDLLEKITSRVPGKTVEQIKEHYEALVDDIKMIESGCVPLPRYKNPKEDEIKGSSDAARNKPTHRPRKKGIPWTPEEHEKFLVGLEKYGKGDWRSISRNCVQTRNPTQIASHAQKYYNRLQKQNQKLSSASASASASSSSSRPPDPSGGSTAAQPSASSFPLYNPHQS